MGSLGRSRCRPVLRTVLAGFRRCRAGSRRLLAAGLVLALAGLPGCDRHPTDGLVQARGLIAQHDRAGALIRLKSLIQDDPTSGQARLLLGSLLLDSGDAVAAEIALRRAAELGQPPAQVAPLLARALLASGQARKVVDQFAALDLDQPQASAELQSTLAEAQATLGDLPAARRHLQQALQARPGFAPALLLQARVTAVAGDTAAALRQIDTLLVDQPRDAEAWLLKGDLLLRQHADPALAEQVFRQSLALRADGPGAHAALISLSLGRRDLAAARAQFEAMRKALPTHVMTRLYEGQIALAAGDLSQARALFQTVLRVAPDNLMLLQSAGAVELGLGAPAQAELLLVRALQVDPESAASRRLLAQCHLAQGQTAKVLAVLDPLLGQASTDAQALALAARAQLLAGNAVAATTLFERAGKLKPDDPQIGTALALSHLSRGKGEGAIAELQSLAAADPGSTADLALVSTLLRRKDYAGALAALDVLDRKQPGQPLAPHLRGQVALQQNNPAAARAAFEQAVARDAVYFPSVAALAGLDFLEQRPDAAQARFDALLKVDPGHVGARLALAELAARRGAGRAVVAGLLEAAVKSRPTDLGARLALVEHHLATRQPKAAVLVAQAGLGLLPDQAELLSALGRSQLASGDSRQAIASYQRLVTLQPRSPVGPLGLAESQLAAGDLAVAARSVKRALDLVPDALPAQRLAITLALRQQQPAQALAVAREVQRQRPGQAVGFLLEGEIEIVQRHWEAAVPPLRKALARGDPAQAPERLHHALRQGGKPAEADAFAQAWLSDHPRDALFQFYLGDVAVAHNDLAGAEQRYQAVLALLPGHALSLNNIAWLLLQQQRPGALAYAERAVAAAPDTPALMDTLALAYAADQQTAKAITLQQQALALAPDDAALRFNLARFYIQAREKRSAKAELDRLAALGGRFDRQPEVAAMRQGLGGR